MATPEETQVARNYQTIIENIPAASVQHKSLNVLFFGPPGQGKTSTINYLLGQSSLAVSVDDEIQTTNVQTSSGRFHDYYVKCVDFPGVRGNPAEEDILSKHTEHLEQVCRSCPKGIHAVAIVLKFGNRFYEEDEYSLQMLKQLFSESYLETHGTCILTHGALFEANMRRSPAPKSFSQWCQDQKGVLEKYFKACNFHCVMLDNLSDEISIKQAKVQELLARSTIGWHQPAKSISPQLRALADIHLLVEVGSSEESYRKQLTFLVRYLQDFDPRYTSVMITGRNKTHFYGFRTFDNHTELVATLYSTEYLEPCRATEKSLLILRKESFRANAGMRPDVKQVALMLTEGRTDDETKLAREAENLRHTGAKLMVVGVSCTDRHLLEMIAADPEDVFMAEDYEELQAFPGMINHRTCELAPKFECAADILIMIDASSSIGPVDYKKELDFVIKLTETFNLGPTAANFSVIVFSSFPKIISSFDITSHAEIKEIVSEAPYQSQSTDTAAALRMARTKAFTPSNCVRQNAKKIVFVLTDGESNTPDETAEEAELLKQTGTMAMAVGVASAKVEELKKIASFPENVYYVSSFDLLQNLLDEVAGALCKLERKIDEQRRLEQEKQREIELARLAEEQRLAMLKKQEEDKTIVDDLIENLLATSLKQDDINMLFVGPSASGKNHCSNAILGSSLKSQHITTQTSSVNVCSSRYEKYDVKILECSIAAGVDIDCACAEVLPYVLKSCPKGIHVPVLVMSLEQSVLQINADFEINVLKRCFGEEYLEKYGICIVSSSDGSGPLASGFDEWCRQQNDAAQRMFEAFNYRCVYFSDGNKDQQVPEFMARVMSCWPQPVDTVSVNPETRVYAEMNVVVQSASSAEAFHMQMQFVSQYTGDYSGSEVKACVTVVGQSQHTRIGAIEFETHQEFERALMSTPFLGHCPGLHRALEAAKMESIAASKDRPEVKKMAIVLNNGDYDDEDEAVEEATELKKVVSEVMVVSVGSTNQRKLEKIASSSDSVFIAADETELIHKCTEQVKHRTCEIEQKIEEQRQAMLRKKEEDKRIVDGLIENLLATSLKQDDINMLFVGPSGSGKSHCTNAFLGSSLKSQNITTLTSSMNVCSSRYEKYDIKIVECTVGAGLDIDCACADVLPQVLKSCPKGIHVPVLVVRLELSVLKINANIEMQILKRSFGDDFVKNNGICIVSCSDGSGPLASGFDEWIRQQNDAAQRIFEAFNYRCVYFSDGNKDQQVPEFMARIMSCWPQPVNTVSVNPQMRASADVDVIVQSASTAEAFQQQMQFVSKYTGDYDRSEVKASVTVVGKDQHKCIGASQFDTQQEFETALVTTPFLGHCPGLHRALEVARKESIAASKDRPEVKKMAIVLNNGDYDDEDEAVEEATELKKVVSEVMVVSVGSTNQRKLEKIASSPDSVFIAADETELIHKCTEQVKHRTCEIAPQYSSTANICFLIDSSGSIGLDYKKELNFVVGLTELFNIGLEAAQFSAMIYSNDVRVLFNFESLTHEEIKEKVLKATFIGLGTNTAEALKTARLQTFPTADSTRENNIKIAIVITDGQSQNTNQTYQEAEALIAAGVRTMAIGVGAGAVKDELRKIACRANYVYSVDGFNVLQTVHDEIARLTSNLGTDTDNEIQEYRRSLRGY